MVVVAEGGLPSRQWPSVGGWIAPSYVCMYVCMYISFTLLSPLLKNSLCSVSFRFVSICSIRGGGVEGVNEQGPR